MKGVDTTHSSIGITTSDAKQMYSNIKTVEGIEVVTECIKTFRHEYNGYFLRKLVVILLELTMPKNIFRFGETW